MNGIDQAILKCKMVLRIRYRKMKSRRVLRSYCCSVLLSAGEAGVQLIILFLTSAL